MIWLQHHEMYFRAAAVVFGIAFVGLLATISIRPDGKPGRHSRGIRFGTPAEIRRHRAGRARTWAGTRSVCRRPAATPHLLDGRPGQRPAGNLLESTGEITSADLETILGFRPRNLAVAA